MLRQTIGDHEGAQKEGLCDHYRGAQNGGLVTITVGSKRKIGDHYRGLKAEDWWPLRGVKKEDW